MFLPNSQPESGPQPENSGRFNHAQGCQATTRVSAHPSLTTRRARVCSRSVRHSAVSCCSSRGPLAVAVRKRPDSRQSRTSRRAVRKGIHDRGTEDTKIGVELNLGSGRWRRAVYPRLRTSNSEPRTPNAR